MPFDKTKNQRKGFCFITFESEQVVQELLKSPKQSINGKEVMLIFVGCLALLDFILNITIAC
jgi:hypothetical protein